MQGWPTRGLTAVASRQQCGVFFWRVSFGGTGIRCGIRALRETPAPLAWMCLALTASAPRTIWPLSAPHMGRAVLPSWQLAAA